MKKFLLSIFCCLMAFLSVQAQNNYVKVTDASTLKAGDKLVLCSGETSKGTFVAGDISSSIMASVAVTITDGTITSLPNGAIELTLGGSAGAWTFSNSNGKLLGSTANKKVAWGSGTTTWAITIDSNGSATIQNSTSSYGRFLYNVNSPRFTTYTSNASASMVLPQLYRLEVAGEGGGDVTPDPVDVEEPTFNPADGSTFDETLEVTINAANGLTTFYSVTGEDGKYIEGSSVEISATTTVYAYAQDADGNKSDIVSATYTKNIPVDPNAKTATISFASTAQRISQDTNKQVWVNDGITLTNNKSNSTTNVANYYNPARFYKSSEIVVECSLGNIVQMVFDCKSSSYATELKNSIGEEAIVSVSSDIVTITPNSLSNSFTIANLAAQVQVEALTVRYVVAATKPMAPTLTAGGNFVGSKSVAITCATEGAKIYYTTNGDEPTAVNGTEYSAPFDITETTTVKAIAVNEVGESGVVTATYTRVAATPEISFSGEATFEESIEVTVNAAEGTTAYYTLSGSDPTNKSTKYTEPLTIKAGATLKVIAYDEDGYKSEVVEQKFVMATGESAGAAAGTATLVENVADLAIGDQIVIVAADSNFALSTTQNDNNRGRVEITKDGNNVTLVDNVQILTLEKGTVDGTFAFNTGSGYLYAASSSSNHLRTQTTNNANGSWSIEIESGKATIEAQGTNTRNLLKYNNNNSLFSCYASGQQAVSIYKVNIATIEDYILNVTDAGWATLFLGHNVVIPDDVTCYVIDEIDGTVVNLNQVEGALPANTAVIIEAEEGEYTFEATEETATVENVMAGTLKNEYITKEAYVLGADENGVVGLYKAEMAGGVWLNNANKAYLPADAVPAALQGTASFSFRYEGTTSIEEVETENAVKAIYDLTGRRVETITAPGIYIVNGKKVLVK